MNTSYEKEAVRLAGECNQLKLENARLRGQIATGPDPEPQPRTSWIISAQLDADAPPINLTLIRTPAQGEQEHVLGEMTLEEAKKLASQLEGAIGTIEAHRREVHS